MKAEFKITRKQQAFINAKEDEVLYGGALSEGASRQRFLPKGKKASEEKREQRGRSR